MECPYFKMAPRGQYAIQAAGERHAGPLPASPSFELGKVGVGMEHEMLTDRNWGGQMHMFQLWVNLPGRSKFDAPHFQNVASSALPRVDAGEGCAVHIMHGASLLLVRGWWDLARG